MKEKIVTALLNLIKVKSLLTFVAAFVFVYMVITKQIEPATVTAILMLVFKELFDKNKMTKEDTEDGRGNSNDTNSR